MNRRKLGKKDFLEVAISIVIAMVFVMPASSMVATFESESISDDTVISIEPAMQTIKKGETFTISIYVIPSEPVVCVNVGNLSFDSSLIHANAVTEGDIFDPYETFMPGSIDNIAGNIDGIEGATTPSNATTDEGILCSISFTAQEEIGTSVLDIEDATVTNTSGSTISIVIDDGSATVVAWSVVLNFNEHSGKSDYAIFGEMHDANDGPPVDIYDSEKPPAPRPPYIRAWFDDNLSIPYHELWEDYRQYPDTEKVWDLYAQWDDSSTPTSITISWDMNEFDNCEYASVILTRYNPFPPEDPVGWEFAADMLLSNNYVYAPRYFGGWLKDHFQINATDMIPPVISEVVLTNSTPIDTDAPYGWENVTCNVTDNVAVRQVKLIVTNDTATVEYDMTNIPESDTYYYNTTITQPGFYNYSIWADDFSENTNTTDLERFEIPPNWDVNKDGKGYIEDFVLVAGHYGESGPTKGWIREDVNNDGKAYIEDFVLIAGHYGEEWK